MRFKLEDWFEEYCRSHKDFKFVKSRFRHSKLKDIQKCFLKGITEKYG